MIVLTSLGAEGELVELLTLGQGPLSALTVAVADPPLLPAPQSAIGLDGSEPVEMELLPAGHAAGLYLLLRVLVRRVGSGGLLLQTISYSAPLIGPVSSALPPELLFGDPGPIVVPPVPFYSNGETAVVLSTVFDSPVSPLVLDVYAAAVR